MDRIPKIIHQIWIGPFVPPLACMASWSEKNPDFKYIFWTEAEFERRGIVFEAQEKIDMIGEYSGKTDIMRLEILSKYGGIFIDADSICIEPIGELFERFYDKSGFATFENETSRKGLIANGNLAVKPNHFILRDMLDWILSPEANEPIRNLRSWGSVGPALLTRFLETGKYPGFMVLPSYYFLPIHFTGEKYTGHRKVYAHQLWGSNYAAYENGLKYNLPMDLLTPLTEITLMIDLNNRYPISIRTTLETIKNQCGYFEIDMVIILDDTDIYEKYYREIFTIFERTSRFIHISIIKKDDFDTIFLNKSYIQIHPRCILTPNTIQDVIAGASLSVPIYTEDNEGKISIINDTFLIRLYYSI